MAHSAWHSAIYNARRSTINYNFNAEVWSDIIVKKPKYPSITKRRSAKRICMTTELLNIETRVRLDFQALGTWGTSKNVGSSELIRVYPKKK